MGVVSFQNATQNTKFTPISLVPPPGAQMLGNTAEWILEAPTLTSLQNQLAHIPSFTPVSFTTCSACLTGSPTIGNPENATIVTSNNDSSLALTTTTGDMTVAISYKSEPQSHVVSQPQMETANT